MPSKADDLIAALDIGSSKIACAIAQPLSDRTYRIVGMGVCGSVGVREGVLVEINPLVDAIRQTVEEAEKSADVNISRVAAGISGTHIMSDNVHMTVVTRRGEIEQSDVDEIFRNVQQTSLPPSMRYLQVLAEEYAIDFKWGYHRPVGMDGNRLDAKLHVITAQTSPCQNIGKAIRRSGLELIESRLNFNPLSSASAVLTQEEKNLGVILIDLGAELTEVAVYYGNAVQYTAVFPGGGESLTNEISIKTQLSKIDAENLKVSMGHVRFDPHCDKNDSYDLPSYAGFAHEHNRVLTRQALSGIIDMKLRDILEAIYNRLRDKNLRHLISYGVVLTGGSAQLKGIERLVREVFSGYMAGGYINVRIGYPIIEYETNIFYSPNKFSTETLPEKLAGVSSPEYATLFGYLADETARYYGGGGAPRKKGGLTTVKNMLKSWFTGNF